MVLRRGLTVPLNASRLKKKKEKIVWPSVRVQKTETPDRAETSYPESPVPLSVRLAVSPSTEDA